MTYNPMTTPKRKSKWVRLRVGQKRRAGYQWRDIGGLLVWRLGPAHLVGLLITAADGRKIQYRAPRIRK